MAFFAAWLFSLIRAIRIAKIILSYLHAKRCTVSKIMISFFYPKSKRWAFWRCFFSDDAVCSRGGAPVQVNAAAGICHENAYDIHSLYVDVILMHALWKKGGQMSRKGEKARYRVIFARPQESYPQAVDAVDFRFGGRVDIAEASRFWGLKAKFYAAYPFRQSRKCPDPKRIYPEGFNSSTFLWKLPPVFHILSQPQNAVTDRV